MSDQPDHIPEPAARVDDAAIGALVARLSRPHPSGGRVIERATILAEGSHSAAILAWIADHDWEAETVAAAPSGGGLHDNRLRQDDRAGRRVPRRYVQRPVAEG
jgi:hypothetical protein